MDPIAVAEVQRGDLLLVTHRPDDALADLILELDRSPDGFSHCGIALGDGRVLSAFPDLWEVRGFEFGGLSDDEFGFFWRHEQHIHRLDVDHVERDAAAGRLRRWLPPDGGFSIPKIVMVAAVLHALAPENDIDSEAADRVVRSAIAAAAAWSGDGDYYCAEFVAEVYGWHFVLEDLRPPAPPLGLTFLPQTLVRLTVDVARPLLSAGRSVRQQAFLHAFVEDVQEYDPEFFEHGLSATLSALLGRTDDDVTKARHQVRRRHDLTAPATGDRTPLPRPLVTPRMLRARCAHAAIPEIRPE